MDNRFCIVLLFTIILIGPGFAATCGDGACDSGENSCNCQSDCGKCSGDVPNQLCKEYSCVSDICKIVVVSNCCGNNSCEENTNYTENYGNCPGDCTPKEITVEVLSPNEEYYTLGENVIFRVQIDADGRSISSPDVNAEGFFGNLELFNDGKHDDERPWDNVFANTFRVESGMNAGVFPIFVQTAFLGIDGNATIDFEIRHALETSLELENQYSLGDIIQVKGTVSKKDIAMQVPIDVNIVAGQKTLLEKSIESDANGFFQANYHISLLDSAGNWTMGLHAVDANGNYVFVEREIIVVEPIQIPPLNIEFVTEFEEKYAKGREIAFIVKLINDEKQLVENAMVKMELPGGESIALNELQPGVYSTVYTINHSLPAGLQEFTIRASETRGQASIEGIESKLLAIEAIELEMEIVAPNRLSYAVGEQMEIRLKVNYPDGGGPVNNAEAKALVGSEEIALELTEVGIYTGSYAVKDGDEGEMRVFFSASDDGGNKALGERFVKVSGKVFWHGLVQNLFAIALGIGMLVVGGIVAFFLVFKKNKLVGLQKKKAELEANQKRAQKNYFDGGALSKAEYGELMEKYESEMAKIGEEIKLEKKK